MRKRQLIILLILLFAVFSNAQKVNTKQKKDDWQEYKYADFTVKFPAKPRTTEKFYQLAEESVRYSAIDSKGIEYSVDNLKFSKEIWAILEDFDAQKTVYDNLELQWIEGFGAKLLFRSETYQQNVSGRDQFFQYKDKSGNFFDVMQKAFKKGERVFVVRTIIPLPLMKKVSPKSIDFPPIVNEYFEAFKFNSVEEINNFPPPPLKKPA